MGTVSKQKVATKLVELSPEEVRKLPRPHKGFDVFALRLVTWYRAHASILPTTGLDLDALVEHVRAYQALAEPEYEAQKQLTRLQNTRLLHSSAAWSILLEMYARAVAIGRVNATIKAGIADFVEFMKQARKKATPASTSSTPAKPSLT